MSLLLAGLGIVLSFWLGMARRVFVTAAPGSVGVSPSRVAHLAAVSDRSWTRPRLLRGPFRMATVCALLTWGVAVGIRAIQSQPGIPPAQTIAAPTSATGAEFYLRRGEDSASSHEYDRAITDYTAAIELKPAYAEAYNDRGFARYLKGDFDRAIADYTRAIELRPDYAQAYNSRGVIYMGGGYGRAKAVADFDRAIALKPDFWYAHINRANARMLRHPWLALSDFHRAGMYPERRVAMFGGALLAVGAAIVVARRKRGRVASGSV